MKPMRHVLPECDIRDEILRSGTGLSVCHNKHCPLSRWDMCRMWRECYIGKTYCCLKCEKAFSYLDKVC